MSDLSTDIKVNPKELFTMFDRNRALQAVVCRPLPAGLLHIFPSVRAMSKTHLDSLVDLKSTFERRGLVDEAWDDSFCSMSGTFTVQAPNYFEPKKEYSDDYYSVVLNRITAIIEFFGRDYSNKVRIPLTSSSGAPYFASGDAKKINLHMHAKKIVDGAMPLIGHPECRYIIVGGRNSRQNPLKERIGKGPNGLFSYNSLIGDYGPLKIGTGRMRPVNNYSSEGQLGWAVNISTIHHIFTLPCYKAYEPDEMTKLLKELKISWGQKIDIKQFDSTLTEKQISTVLEALCYNTSIDYRNVLEFFTYPQIFKKSAQEKGKFWVSGNLSTGKSDWRGNTSGIRGTTEINCLSCDNFIIYPILERLGANMSVSNCVNSILLKPLLDSSGSALEIFVLRTGDDVFFMGTEKTKSMEHELLKIIKEFEFFNLDLETPGKGGQIFIKDKYTGYLESYLNPKSFYGNRLFIEKRLDSFHTKYKVLIGFKLLQQSYRHLYRAEVHFSLLDSWTRTNFGKTLREWSYLQSLVQDPPDSDVFLGDSEYIEDAQKLFWKDYSESLIERFGTDHITFLDPNLQKQIQNLIFKETL